MLRYEDVFQKKTTYVKPIPTITVNLALPPLDRWRAVLEECADNHVNVMELVKESQQFMDTLLPKSLRSNSRSFIGQWIRYGFLIFLGLLCRIFFAYSEDLVAIATLTNRYTGELFLANMTYEILGGCTSFVAHSKDGYPMLARTLDWPMPMLAKYTVQFRWIRKESDGLQSARDDDDVNDQNEEAQLLFYSVGWPGYVGVMTGLKPFKFGIALNARYPDVTPSVVIPFMLRNIALWNDEEAIEEATENISRALSRLRSALCFTAWSSGSIIRETLQRPDMRTYAEAVAFLSTERVVGPCYFIVAGVDANEGVVLTRDAAPLTSNDIFGMRCIDSDSSTDKYVCQTNIDVPQQYDNSPEDFNSVDRYNITDEKLSEYSASFNTVSPAEAALILMSSMNKNRGVRMKITLYCSIMVPANSSLVSARSTRPIGP